MTSENLSKFKGYTRRLKSNIIVLQNKKAERDNAFSDISNHSSSDRAYVGTPTKFRKLIDILLDLEDQLTDKEIRDEVNTMIMAGHENISTVLMLTLVLVGSYPEVQDKIMQRRAFAMMSVKITLALILWNYRVYGDRKNMTLKLDSVLKPAAGHHITIERRCNKV